MRTIKYVMLTGCLAIMAAPAAAQENIGWVTDWRVARDRAQSENRLVLLHFWSPSCGPCKQLERNVFNRADVGRAIAAGYIPVKINVDESPQLRQFYQVTSWPHDVIVDPSGRVLQRKSSPQDPNEYIALLDTVKAQYYAGVQPSHVARAGGLAAADSSGYQPAGSRSPAQTSPAASAQQAPWSNSNLTQTQPYPGNARAAQQHYADSPLERNHAAQSMTLAPQYSQSYEADNTPATDAGTGRVQWNRHLSQSSSPADADELAADRQTPAANHQLGGSWGASSGQAAALDAPSAGSGPVWQPQQSASSPQIGADSLSSPYQPQGSSSRDIGQPNRSANAIPGGAPGFNPNARNQGGAAAANGWNTESAAPHAAERQQPQQTPSLGLDGFCPVSLVEQNTWAQGDRRWGAVHRQRIYLFASQAHQQKFFSNPDSYSPVLSGFDPVRYAESGQLVEGKREHGLYYGAQYYLFADEAALERFRTDPNRYVAIVQQAMQQRAMQR